MNEQSHKLLNRVEIKGFRSIKECKLDLKSINVLIGANGAGKTNFISIFEMLQFVLARELALYTGVKGVPPLLYRGKSVTDSISAEFYFDTFQYSFDLIWTENESMLFKGESLVVAEKELLGAGGHNESNALNILRKTNNGADIPQIMLKPGWRIYRFNNTSSSSQIKEGHNISNNATLMDNARNLAAYLYRLKQQFPKEYIDILYAVQLVAPFFKDFVLKPNVLNEEHIVLRWQEKGCEDEFNASQLSDGTLRFICLVTLLLQPIELQPDIIIIDEPELGLHPYAITVFTELVKKAATNKQIILSTQSVELLNYFDAGDVVVVDKGANGSEFKRLDPNDLAEWLEDDYSLGELWNKNIFGGRFAQ